MPTRRECVTIPVDLHLDPRVVQFALHTSMDLLQAVHLVIQVLAGIAKLRPDERSEGVDHVIHSLARSEQVYRVFCEMFLDKGRVLLYDEYNGARDRKRSRARQARKKPRKVAFRVDGFEAAWSCYPKRSGGNPRATAFKAWQARVKEGVPPEEMLMATRHYAEHCRAEQKVGTPYVLQGGTFYGPSQRWKDFLAAPPDPELDDIMAEIRNLQEG